MGGIADLGACFARSRVDGQASVRYVELTAEVAGLEVNAHRNQMKFKGLAPNPTVIEFFAGIGLMRIGLERAGWRTVWANDIDAEKERMYRGHFLESADGEGGRSREI